jgi:hypothetical protein
MRLLLAQGRGEDVPIVSADVLFEARGSGGPAGMMRSLICPALRRTYTLESEDRHAAR